MQLKRLNSSAVEMIHTVEIISTASTTLNCVVAYRKFTVDFNRLNRILQLWPFVWRGFESWSKHELVAFFPFLSPSLLHQSFVCTNSTRATFRNEEKKAKIVIFCLFTILNLTVNHTVMHRHDGPQILKWQSDTVFYGINRQTVFWRTVPSHRHCPALILTKRAIIFSNLPVFLYQSCIFMNWCKGRLRQRLVKWNAAAEYFRQSKKKGGSIEWPGTVLGWQRQDLKLAAVLLDELGLEVVIKVRCIFKLVPKKLLIEMCPDWRLQHLGVAETNYVYTSGLISFCTIAWNVRRAQNNYVIWPLWSTHHLHAFLSDQRSVVWNALRPLAFRKPLKLRISMKRASCGSVSGPGLFTRDQRWVMLANMLWNLTHRRPKLESPFWPENHLLESIAGLTMT